MKAFILAAGFGKRMGSYTKNLPKPLLSIQEVKLLDYAFYMIHKWEIARIIINTHYLSEKIEDYLKKFIKVDIQISKEEKILGTGGGIYTGIKKFGTNFHFMKKTPNDAQIIETTSELGDEAYVLINPDTIIFPDQDSFCPNFPEEEKSLCHLYLRPLPQGANYTGLFLKDMKVYFNPIIDSIPCYYIGLAVLKPICLELSETKYEIGQSFELIDVFKNLSRKGLLTGEIFSGSAIDIGEKEFYESILKSKDFFKGRRSEILSTIQFMQS